MSITRGDLKSKVQRRIGDTATTTFYATALYNDIIDTSVRTQASLIMRLNPNWYMESTTITGVDDATDVLFEVYDLPSNFRVFVRLERQHGTGTGITYQEVPCVNVEDQDIICASNYTLIAPSDSVVTAPQIVAVWATTLRIRPAPADNNYLYRLVYLRRPIDSTADNDYLDIPDEWQELIILDCAIKIMNTLGDPIAGNVMNDYLREMKFLRDDYRRRSMNIGSVPEILL